MAKKRNSPRKIRQSRNRSLAEVPPLLAEYEALYTRWPQPSDMIAAARAGEAISFSTDEHLTLSWTVQSGEGAAALLLAKAPLSFEHSEPVITSWWNTTGRGAPPHEVAASLQKALQHLLTVTDAAKSVHTDVNADAPDGADVTFLCEADVTDECKTWQDFTQLLRPLTSLALAQHFPSVSVDKSLVESALAANGLHLVACSRCGEYITDHYPGFPTGLWMDTTEGAAGVCGRPQDSLNPTVSFLNLPHTPREVAHLFAARRFAQGAMDGLGRS